jgi:hypothetical protein
MTHYPRTFPQQTPMVAIVGLLLTAALAVGIVLSVVQPTFTFSAPAQQPTGDLVMEGARSWELQRLQQSGWTDPVLKGGRAWEQQRLQQSPSGAVTVPPIKESLEFYPGGPVIR